MLETEYLKLKYHDNVESNTDEVDAEEYFNNNYKKIDTNAKKTQEDLIKIKEDLQQENAELSNNMPWNTVKGESLHIEDSAKYSRNKLSVGGNLRQKTTKGLQLYNCKDWYFKTSDIAIDKDDYITITADNSSGTGNLYKEFHAKLNSLIKISTEYTFVIEIKKINGNGFLRINSTSSGKIISQFPASATYNFSDLNTGQIIKYKATSLSDFSEFNIFLRSNAYFEAGQSGSITLRISVLEGDKTTEDFIYEPFTGGKAKPNTEYPSMPVVCTGVQTIRQNGKNLFDYITNLKKANNGLTNTINADGSITTTGKITSGYTKVVDFTNITNILKDGQQYTLEQDVADINLFIQIRAKKEDGNSSYYGTNYSNKVTFTVDKNTYVQYDIYVTTATTDKWGNDSKTITNRYMLYKESDNVDDTFEPYTETVHTLDLDSTELCKIGDVQDRAVYRNNKWQWEKKIGKIVLNGTEAWRTSTVDTSINTIRFAKTVQNINVKGSISFNNNFQTRTGGAHTDTEYLYLPSETIYININKDKLTDTTVTAFKEWLANNNTVVYYILETPQHIDCTAEQSAVLDKLYNNFKLSKGTNNIIVESENGVGVNLELEYMQDNVLKHDKDIAELKQAIVALGGVI